MLLDRSELGLVKTTTLGSLDKLRKEEIAILDETVSFQAVALLAH